MARIDFFFDYLSPYAYLAQTQLRSFDVPIAYHPFDVRKLMLEAGNVPTSVICKPKNRYIQADLRRWAGRYDVPFARHDRILAIDSNRLLRATLWADAHGTVDTVVAALFDALWAEPAPLDTPSDVARIVGRAGVDDPAIEEGMDDPAWHDRLDRATSEAVARGVFGAPCMFVGEEMFFGNDRLDFVRVASGCTT